MKKFVTVLLLALFIGIVFSACKTQERCDAYKPSRNHSRY